MEYNISIISVFKRFLNSYDLLYNTKKLIKYLFISIIFIYIYYLYIKFLYVLGIK